MFFLIFLKVHHASANPKLINKKYFQSNIIPAQNRTNLVRFHYKEKVLPVFLAGHMLLPWLDQASPNAHSPNFTNSIANTF